MSVPTDGEFLVALRTVIAWLAPMLGVQAAPSVYTSLALPPGCSRRRFAERCVTVSEAYRDGKVWICSVAAWERAARWRTQPLALIEADDSAPRLLARAGIRRAAGGAR